MLLFPARNPGETIHGGFTNITLGWGLGVTMGIYIAGKVSGAHLNPAVTLAVAVFRKFPWSKVIPYSIAQTAGAFAAAGLVFWNYRPAFHQVDPQLQSTAGVFTTFPAFPGLPHAGFLDQLIGTGLLMLLVFAITDEYNAPPGSNMVPALYDDGAGKHFMVAANGTSLVNYDVTNPASILSTWSTSLNNEQVTSAPVIVNGYAIAGTVAGGLYVVSPQGGIVWSARLGKPVAPNSERGGALPMTGLAAGDGIVVVPTEDDNATHQTLFVFGPQ